MTSESEPTCRGWPSLARKARTLAVRERLFAPGCRALVMVSGGQDSVALLYFLASGSAGRAGPQAVHALHVNHHLRGDESDADEALVARLCERLCVPLAVAHRPIDKAAGSVQERARDGRRAAALSEATERWCESIALGHTLDDQAETMLYRLGRYGGLAAFRGMIPRDPPWVRPLLGCRRKETAAYCREKGLEFAEDRGNAYPGYARTGIRESVLPAWEACLPGAIEASARAAEVSAEVERLVADLLADAASAVGLRDATDRPMIGEAAGMAQSQGLSVARLLQCYPPLRRLLLHQWLEGRARPAASRAAVLAVESLLSVPGSAGRNLAHGWRALKEYDHLYLERCAGTQGGAAQIERRPESLQPVGLSFPGEAEWGDFRIHCEPADRFRAPDVTREAYVDARCLKGQLLVRGSLPGDRVWPLGAPGTRKLQDLLVDLRIPATARARVPLLVRDDDIIWVCGLVVSEQGRIVTDTTDVVRLWIERLHGGRGSG